MRKTCFFSVDYFVLFFTLNVYDLQTFGLLSDIGQYKNMEINVVYDL